MLPSYVGCQDVFLCLYLGSRSELGFLLVVVIQARIERVWGIAMTIIRAVLAASAMEIQPTTQVSTLHNL
jgi:hypothetical protein